MAGTMFRDLVDPSTRKGHARGYTVGLSIVAHAMIIAGAILVPLIAAGIDLAPVPSSIGTFTVAAALPPQPLPAVAPHAQARGPQAPVNPGAAPLEQPAEIAPERVVPALVESELGVDIPGTVIGSVVALAPAPAPPSPPPPEQQAPVHTGGNVKPPLKIVDVLPVYPALAQATRVQGVVIIEATIGPTGRVDAARVLRSIPLLDDAALDAVRQWEYTPTLLNGMPVSVVMTVTVEFRLR
jgi:protein TonB